MKKSPIEESIQRIINEAIRFGTERDGRVAGVAGDREAEIEVTKDLDGKATTEFGDDRNTAMELAFRITKDYLAQHSESDNSDTRKYLNHWLSQVLQGMLQTQQWQSGQDLKNMTFNLRRNFVAEGIESFVEFVETSFDDNESVLNYQTPSAKTAKTKSEPKTATPVVEPSVEAGNLFLIHISNMLRLNGYETIANTSNTHIVVQKSGQKIASLQLHHGNPVLIDEGAIFAEQWAEAVCVSRLHKEQIAIAIQSDFSNQEIIRMTNEMTKHFALEESAHKQYKLQQQRKNELLMTLNMAMVTTQGFY